MMKEKKDVLVTIEERRWIEQNAVIEVGKNVKYKVMDVDKVVGYVREERLANGLSSLINILPKYVDKYKKPNRSFTYQKDPITSVYYGILLRSDEYGGMVWQRLQLSEGLPLNIDRQDEARIWCVIRFNPSIEGSPFESFNPDKPAYYVDDPVKRATKEIEETELLVEGFGRVEKISNDPKSMIYFARLLGHDVNSSSNYQIVRGILLRSVRDNPKRFKNRWESNNRSVAEIFFSAKSLGVITHYPDRGFQYKGTPIGLDENEAISYLAKEHLLTTAINKDIAEIDSVVNNIQSELESTKPGKKKSKEPVQTTEEFE